MAADENQMPMQHEVGGLEGSIVVGDGYEVPANLTDETGEETLSYSYTSNNGIRLQILNDDILDWAVFDLTKEQAELVGNALLRWANQVN